MHVLLIEDDEALESVLVEVLAEADIDAHRTLPPSGVDAVITDLVGLRAYDLTAAREYVRSLRRTHRVPIIVLTAHSRAAADGAAQIGADEVITKPFDVDALAARVRSVIRDKEDPSAAERAVEHTRARTPEPA